MPEEILDDADVHTPFQKVGGEAMAEGVDRHRLVDVGGLGRSATRPFE